MVEEREKLTIKELVIETVDSIAVPQTTKENLKIFDPTPQSNLDQIERDQNQMVESFQLEYTKKFSCRQIQRFGQFFAIFGQKMCSWTISGQM